MAVIRFVFAMEGKTWFRLCHIPKTVKHYTVYISDITTYHLCLDYTVSQMFGHIVDH